MQASPDRGNISAMLERVTGNLRRLLYAGGSRADRLSDPDAVVRALRVSPGSVVGDLGPGAGHFTIRLAQAVGADGVVYALDASRPTLDELTELAEQRGLTNLRTVPVPRDRLEIPEPMDLLFVSATYHHIHDRVRYFADARAHLRPGGRIAILEGRREGLLARWMAPHHSDPRAVVDEMTRAGYRVVGTHDLVRGYLFAIFQASEPAP